MVESSIVKLRHAMCNKRGMSWRRRDQEGGHVGIIHGAGCKVLLRDPGDDTELDQDRETVCPEDHGRAVQDTGEGPEEFPQGPWHEH